MYLRAFFTPDERGILIKFLRKRAMLLLSNMLRANCAIWKTKQKTVSCWKKKSSPLLYKICRLHVQIHRGYSSSQGLFLSSCVFSLLPEFWISFHTTIKLSFTAKELYESVSLIFDIKFAAQKLKVLCCWSEILLHVSTITDKPQRNTLKSK